MGRLKRSSGLPATTLVPLVVIAFALVGLVVVGIVSAIDPFGTDTVDRSAPALLRRIRTLDRFQAAEGQFVETVDLEQDAKFLPSFLKGERVLANVPGSVSATVDFRDLTDDAVQVSDDRRSIRLVLPEPELQRAEVDEGRTKILTRDRGVIDRIDDFFSGNPTDDGPLFRAAQDKIDAAAAASGLRTKGKDETERWLRTFLGAAGFDNVEIAWTRAPR